MSEKFDIVVVGAGSAGLTAAWFANKLGTKVALVDKGRPGGDCTWTGCVPSKALLRAAKQVQAVRDADFFMGERESRPVNMAKVHGYVRASIDEVYQHETPEKLSADGVEFVSGAARFVSPEEIEVLDGDRSRRITARVFVVCTGARTRKLTIDGIDSLEEHEIIDHTSVFDLTSLPKRLAVVGGGPIGCEMANAFALLGSDVSVLAKEILPRDDDDARAVVQEALEASGVRFVLGSFANKVERTEDGIAVSSDGSRVLVDQVLVAVGRRANTEGLDLDKIGVETSSSAHGGAPVRGIVVDENLKTAVDNIYAAGDCLGGPQFTHYAGFQAFTAVRNALLPGNSGGKPAVIPWVTFTEPELAQVGLTEKAAREMHGDVVVRRVDIGQIDRAITEDDRRGFLKIVTKKNGEILGVTCVARRAGEVVSELVAAVTDGKKLPDLAGIMRPYPTYSSAITSIAADAAVDDAMSGLKGAAIKLLLR